MSLRPSRGSTALEFALVAPVLLAVFMGGFALTRALLTQHRLVEAAAVTARSMAVAGVDQAAMAHALVSQQLGGEAQLCGQTLQVTTARVAGAFAGGEALRIDVRCTYPGVLGLNPFPVAATATFPF